jgi:glucose/arabinose dehydrogenase
MRPILAWTFAALAASSAAAAAQSSLPLERIKLPPGFSVELLARVPSAREMAWGARGTLFVGSTEGSVYAITFASPALDRPKVTVLAKGLQQPVGVAFKDGALYVSAVSRILRFDDVEQHLDAPREPVVVTDRFPKETHHGWKFIAFGPDGKLYVPVGAPCNVCAPDPDRYALISRINADGSGYEVVARGLRNSVGFDWDPRTKDLWATSNGRDMMGDDVPPDTLHHVAKLGENFGYPYCHGGDIPDPEFGKERACKDFSPPAARLGPHVASLGMRFYTGTQFPVEYRNQVFIAEHGSWNRTHKIGYRVTLVRLDANGHVQSYQPFAEGWLQGESAWGRPADVQVAADGSLLVSDDTAGAVYRIRYR